MRTLLRELRSLLEQEAALHGSLVPLGAESDSDELSPEASTEESSPEEASPGRDTAGNAASGNAASGNAASREAASRATDGEPHSAEASSGDASGDDTHAGHDLPAPSTDGETAANTSSAPSPIDASSNNDSSMPNRDLFGNEVDPTQDPSRPPRERIEALIPDDAPYKDLESLEELEKWVAQNPILPIDEDRQNPVFGVGDPHANLLIIGEAPGANEDKQGEPFVGRAGQLLDKILKAINFDRDDVYIANILKSRPPNNRDPLAEEVEAHIPILYKQIALIEPAVILCVGKVAANTMLDRSSSLKSLRDTEHDFYGVPLYATYHPAALLRNSNWKRPTWEDVQLVRTRYDELVS